MERMCYDHSKNNAKKKVRESERVVVGVGASEVVSVIEGLCGGYGRCRCCHSLKCLAGLLDGIHGLSFLP